ncbi:TetR/AcrR family transcriptional regulator [Variovorax sp. CF079]|uniref:TetR/AcrR family transcriptional regulator n=1 Tax=Variovorax sp. CF079 TaxID=1882774 RepID=UPI000B8233E3|nr:TetR/AcrR family transcriptional regulator [Variovorax sp. CF079]
MKRIPDAPVPVKPKSAPRRAAPAATPMPEMPAERLLEAAVALFAQHGFDAVSTGAVAAAAGLTQSMVHYHFGTKEKLWKAAVEHLMHSRGNMFSLNMEDLRDVDHLSRLKVMLRRFISANAADPDLTRILIHEGMNDSPRLKWLAKRFMVRGYATFNAAIESAIAAGVVRKLPPRDVTNVIVGACVLTFTLSRLLNEVYGEMPTTPEAVSSLSDTLLEVLFKGLEAKPRP